MSLRKGGTEYQDAVNSLKRKRARGGHGKTKTALCMSCYDKHKGKFWLSRFNSTTIRTHATMATWLIFLAKMIPELQMQPKILGDFKGKYRN